MKIGIDLGGSHIAIGVVNEEGRIVEKTEKRLSKLTVSEFVPTIETTIIETIEQFRKKYEINKIGIAIPGTVNQTTVVKSVNLGIENYHIIEKLQEKIDLPISIKNDAKCAALAENKYGCLKPYQRSIFLALGTGIGGAAILQDKLLDTGDLPGCEFGHMVILKDGIPCNCGKRGCFEKYASMKSFKNNLRKVLGLDQKTHGEQLLEIIRCNEPNNPDYEKIKTVIEEYIENLALGISNLVNIFEPEAVGIGGSFVFFQEVLLNRLKEELENKNLLFNSNTNLAIHTAVLGNDAGIIGSII